MADDLNRNSPCHCGSGKKYKQCCQNKDESGSGSRIGVLGIAIAFIVGLIILGLAFFGGGGATPDCPPGTAWSEAHQHCH